MNKPMSAKKTGGRRILHKELTITNKLGIHARPAAMFVKTANRFACDIFVEKDGEKINGKSIMGLMMLAAGPGSKLTSARSAPTPTPPSPKSKRSSNASLTRNEVIFDFRFQICDLEFFARQTFIGVST
jgi:phosphotransferase system HPr (HPr) family protein